jgi:hypothetical protein
VLRLTLERKKLRLSQTELGALVADELGHLGFLSRLRSQWAISEVELGRISPTEDELAALARALRFSSPHDLLIPVSPNEEVSA